MTEAQRCNCTSKKPGKETNILSAKAIYGIAGMTTRIAAKKNTRTSHGYKQHE